MHYILPLQYVLFPAPGLPRTSCANGIMGNWWLMAVSCSVYYRACRVDLCSLLYPEIIARVSSNSKMACTDV